MIRRCLLFTLHTCSAIVIIVVEQSGLFFLRLLTALCYSVLLHCSVHLLFFIPQKNILITTKIENSVKNPLFYYSVVAGSPEKY